jgi:hypothetical protein
MAWRVLEAGRIMRQIFLVCALAFSCARPAQSEGALYRISYEGK